MDNDYSGIAIQSMPRLLSLIDRNPVSPTYGCLDRDFWHYRIVRDFPSAVYQQGVLSLAGLYTINFPGNKYYQDEGIKGLCLAGMNYWSKIQSGDGSYCEWFPGERSLVATAFTAFALSESLKLLGGKIGPSEKENILPALKRSGTWLASQKEHFVANHLAGAVAALYNIYQLSNEDVFARAAREKLNELAAFQDDEGWFNEYRGCDIGYLSVTVDYLARYYRSSGSKKALDMCRSALAFMRYFVHPDGSAGGEYSTRNTKYIMRYGLLLLAAEDELAGEILAGLRPEALPCPATVDDRYFTFFFLPNLVQSLGVDLVSRPKVKKEAGLFKFFPQAGLLSIRGDNYHLIVGGKKGGVIKLYRAGNNPRLIYSDTGYFIQDGRAKTFTTHWHNRQAVIKLDDKASPKSVTIITYFARAKGILASPVKFTLLRLYTALFGAWAPMMKIIDWLMKQGLIAGYRAEEIYFKRQIGIGKEAVDIVDLIEGGLITGAKRLIRGVNITEGSSPTSRYFLAGEDLAGYEDLTSKLARLSTEGKILIKRRVSLRT